MKSAFELEVNYATIGQVFGWKDVRENQLRFCGANPMNKEGEIVWNDLRDKQLGVRLNLLTEQWTLVWRHLLDKMLERIS